MSDGTPVTLFNNFAEAQGPLYMTSASDVINDGQIHRTFSTGALMGGDRGKKMLYSGGAELRFATFFETGGVTRHVQPGETREWQQPQKLVHGAAKWRYRETHMAWTRQIIMHNEGMRRGDFDQFVNAKRQLEQMMWTDYWNFDESHLWSEPNYLEQESAAGGQSGEFYPMAAFINEYTNGLYNNSGTAGTQWTTIHGLDPSSTVRGQNRFTHTTHVYSNALTNSSAANAGTTTIFTAMDKAWRKTHFEKPPKSGEFFSNPAYNNQQIFTSEEGQLAYTTGLRGNQDLFAIKGRQDPAFTDPAYNFIPVKYVEALSTATLYPEGTASAITNNSAESTMGGALLYGGGPRFYFVNSNYLYPCFDEDMFFTHGKVSNHFNDPDTFVMPVFIWGNNVCTSRIRQALVRPGGVDVYTNLYT